MSQNVIALNETLEKVLQAQTNIKSVLLSQTFKRPLLTNKVITSNGVYTPSHGYDGFYELQINAIPSVYEELNITSNGTYTPSTGYNGIYKAIVNVTYDYEELNITSNGTYTPSTGYNGISKAIVNVPAQFQELNATDNISYIPDPAYAGFSKITANVQAPITEYIDGTIKTAAFDWDNIPSSAFYGCSSLEYVAFPRCEFIGNNAFYKCINLSEAVFPECLSVHYSAFMYCSNLVMVSLPRCITIAGSAFSNCVNLISLYLTNVNSVIQMYSYAFSLTPIGGYSDIAGRYGDVYVPASLVSDFEKEWTFVKGRIIGV